MLKSMKTSTSLILISATASFLLLLSVGFGLLELSQLKNNLTASLSSLNSETRAILAVEGAQSHFKSQVQEWKDILLRGNDPKNYDKYFDQFEKEEKTVQDHLSSAIALMGSQGIPVSSVEALLAAHRQLGVNYREALKSFDKGDPLTGQHVDKLVKGMDRPASKGMYEIVALIENHAKEKIDHEILKADEVYQSTRVAFTLAGLVAAAFLIALSVAVIRRLLCQLGGEPAYAAEITRKIAKGDLSVEIQTKPGDTASLLANMKNMQFQLREMVGLVQSDAALLTVDANLLAATAQRVAASSHRQSEATASMASSVEQITASFSQVTEGVGETQDIAMKASELSSQGGEVVRDAVDEMNKIAEAVSQSSRFIQTLGEHSHQISAIVLVIKEIADQTNLLALNAAIEAARAGEQGRGFAVVADEVRKLAERTGQSTQEISGMIENILGGTDNAVSSMQEGSARVSEGVVMVNRAGESMSQIRQGTARVLSEIDIISAALREQRAASSEVAENVERTAQMTEENAIAVDEIANTAQQVKLLASSLHQSVARFQM